MNLKLVLSVDEANLVLKGLGNLPYVESFQLINKVKSEVNEQLVEASNEQQQQIEPEKPRPIPPKQQ